MSAILRISARLRRFKHLIAEVDAAKLKSNATVLRNHIIRINKRAQEIYTYLNKSNNPEAKSHSNTMRNLAVRLTGLITKPKPDKKLVTDTYNLLIGEFETIRNNFLPKEWIARWNYAPMKEIRDSLAFISIILKSNEIDAVLALIE